MKKSIIIFIKGLSLKKDIQDKKIVKLLIKMKKIILIKWIRFLLGKTMYNLVNNALWIIFYQINDTNINDK